MRDEDSGSVDYITMLHDIPNEIVRKPLSAQADYYYLTNYNTTNNIFTFTGEMTALNNITFNYSFNVY